jgi:hypothetical protein
VSWSGLGQGLAGSPSNDRVNGRSQHLDGTQTLALGVVGNACLLKR